MGRSAMEAQRALRVVEGGVQLVGPMNPPASDHHHDLCAALAERRPDVMQIWAELLRSTVGHHCIKDFGGAILDRAHDAEQDPPGDAAPGALRHPCLACEGCLACALTWPEGAEREASPLGGAPPARAGQGKAPEDGCVGLEHNHLAPASLGLQSRQLERTLGEIRGGGIQSTGGAVGASRLFFHTSRTLARPRRTPVSRAKTVAHARQLHGDGRAPCSQGA